MPLLQKTTRKAELLRHRFTAFSSNSYAPSRIESQAHSYIHIVIDARCTGSEERVLCYHVISIILSLSPLKGSSKGQMLSNKSI